MKARIVESKKHSFAVYEIDVGELRSWMEVRGYTYAGQNWHISQRDELQNQPTFKEWIGPMWDGDAIRYENQEAYDHLSI